MADTKTVFYGTGRRKRSIARVRLVEGNGTITVNGKDLNDYFGAETLKYIVRQPLSVTETSSKYDVICTVKGEVSQVKLELSVTEFQELY